MALAWPAVWEAERPARRFAMLAVLMDELGVDRETFPELRPDEQIWTLTRAYEELGISQAEIDGWIAECDPPMPVEWSSLDCFRNRLQAATDRPMSVSTAVIVAGVLGFAGASAVIWLRR